VETLIHSTFASRVYTGVGVCGVRWVEWIAISFVCCELFRRFFLRESALWSRYLSILRRPAERRLLEQSSRHRVTKPRLGVADTREFFERPAVHHLLKQSGPLWLVSVFWPSSTVISTPTCCRRLLDQSGPAGVRLLAQVFRVHCEFFETNS